jgi:hypothetical protein
MAGTLARGPVPKKRNYIAWERIVAKLSKRLLRRASCRDSLHVQGNREPGCAVYTYM